MSAEVKKEIELELAHVLFIDIVGYSKLLINDQRALLDTLNQIVRSSDQFRKAEAAERLIKIPTGDGMALVFYNTTEAPVECALEISRALKGHPELQLRMGVHSGPVSGVVDVNERTNVAGAGINMAQRVMDCGDAGHILVSKHVAEDLEHYGHWQPHLHDLGECEVKHGVRVSVANLYTAELGNPRVPEKFRKTKARAVSKAANKKWTLIGILALILATLATGLMFWLGFPFRGLRPDESGSAALPVPEKSIAVLPFENLSRDPDNAYFATGIQDEILTQLAKIGALKVVSRSSTQPYQSRPGDLSTVARQLGVANILEGSVQKVGKAVHINVQLIRAATQDHVWAESYDRELDDAFVVEGKVAASVAAALNAKLTSSEQKIVDAKPTTNSAAYDLYLRGLAEDAQGWYSAEALARAARFYAEAARLDPSFLQAWTRLARMDSLIVFRNYDTSQERRKAGRAALDAAIKLQPDSTETLLAQAYYRYWMLRDYAGAKALFTQLQDRLPNSSEIPYMLSAVVRRQGMWNESLNYSDQAIALSPHDPELFTDRAFTFTVTRQFPNALAALERVFEIKPNDRNTIVRKAAIYQAEGNLDEARRLLDGVPVDLADDSTTYALIQQWLLDRDYKKLTEIVQSQLSSARVSEQTRGLYIEAVAYALFRAGDNAGAHALFLRADDEFETLRRRDPDNPRVIASLAVTKAYLGEKEAALQDGERAVGLVTASIDAVLGPTAEQTLARTEAQLGENERAVARLHRLLSMPYAAYEGPPITSALLRLHPYWDPLRADPRFEKLLQASASKTNP